MRMQLLFKHVLWLLQCIAGPLLAAPAQTIPLTVSDTRSTTLTIWAPDAPKAVVLFSHGHGSWPERYDGLMQALNDAGFAVVAPLHVDSMRYPERDKFGMQQLLPERLADMRATSAEAARRWPDLPVAAAGHSFGTLVSLALGGSLPKLGPLRDPTVVAVLGYSSPERIRGLVDAESYSTNSVPTMLITGDQDLVPGFVADWHDHLYPVETSPAGDKFAVAITGANHVTIGGEPPAQYQRMLHLGTAFLQTYVLDDAKAKKQLQKKPPKGETWIRR